jgi:hypothetical protein
MEYWYETCILKFVFVARSYVHTPSSLAYQFINQRLHVHTHFIPRVSRNYQRHEYVLPLKAHTEGEIDWDNKHGPTCVWGSAHFIGIVPICAQRNTYITRLFDFLSQCHQSVSMLHHRMPFLCHLICFAGSLVMYRHWILGMNGRWRRIVTRMSSCLFCPSPKSTSMNLDDLHFGQYFASAYSFLNSKQPFGQACIYSYIILSAQGVFVPHTCSLAERDPLEIGCQ